MTPVNLQMNTVTLTSPQKCYAHRLFFKAVYTEYDVANVKRMWVLMSEDNCAHVSFSPTFYAHKKFFMQIFINSTWVPMGAHG